MSSLPIVRILANACDLAVRTHWTGSTPGNPQNSLITVTLASNTGSAQSLDTAASWLKNCLENHNHCSGYTASSFTPTRLLYLGYSNDNWELRIHLPEKRPKDVPYATLSHCWGGAKILPLLECNEASFRKLIPYDKLAQTFKDAAKIARHLVFQYLWIDSLCIIQDSDDDWGREASLMGSIYKGSTCNIAAFDARNSHEGCLYERDPSALHPELVFPNQYDTEGEYLVNNTDLYPNHPLYSQA